MRIGEHLWLGCMHLRLLLGRSILINRSIAKVVVLHSATLMHGRGSS